MITYTLTPDPKAHQWHITLKFQNPSDSSVVLKLPNWVPGSYLIRDFSRHIITINAECDEQPAALSQTAKNIWSRGSPNSGRRPISSGWRTSGTGASRASSGGGTASRHGPVPTADTSPWPRRTRRPANDSGERTSSRMRTSWTPGSAARSGPSPRWAGRTIPRSSNTSTRPR